MAKVPEVSYTSADFNTILQALLDEIKKKKAWKDTDFRSGAGRTLLELFAYTADQLHFYIRRLASESYISSAKVRNSLINLGKLISYQVKKPSAATTTLRFRIPNKLKENITIPQYTRCSNADGYQFITTKRGIISSALDSTSVDIPAIQGKRVVETIGESDGSEYQSFPLTYNSVDTYMMNVYVGKESYSIVQNWIDYYRPARTYSRIIHGRDINNPATEPGDWIEEAPPGFSKGWKAVINHNLDLVDPNLFSISAYDSTSFELDATTLHFIYLDPVDENTVNVYWKDNTTTMLVDVKDDLDTRIYYPHREERIDSEAAICIVDYENEDTMKVYFGDGKIGKIPRSGEEIRIEYIRNDGEDGNTGKNTIVSILDTLTTDISGVVQTDITVTNIKEASGGANRESLESIRRSAPLDIRSLKRMVTNQDYKTLISRIPGVQKVQVLDVYNPGNEVVPFRLAKVYVIPTGGGQISNTLRKRIENEIDDRKVLGTVRVISDVTFDDINFTIDLWRSSSSYSLSEVKTNLQEVIETEFSVDNIEREIGDDVDYETLLLNLTETDGVGSITLKINGYQSDITLLDGHYPKLGTLVVNDKGVLSWMKNSIFKNFEN